MEVEHRKIRVLLVEDHDAVAEALTLVLTSLGFVVERAASVAQAAALADGQHALLTDYRLPDGTGAQLLQKLGGRRMPRCLLMSAFLDRHVRQLADECGFDACVDKRDFDEELLQSLLRGE